MQPNSTSALALAGRLRAMDDATLATLLRTREVRDIGIKDFFDLAEKLLEPEAIQSTLSRIDRPTLAALANSTTAAAKPDDRVRALESLALVTSRDEGLVGYDAVLAQLATWPSLGLPSPAELESSPPAALEPLSHTDTRFTDHLAAERAFGMTTIMLEYISELDREPARELARGGIALPDGKRLAAATGAELIELPTIHAIGVTSGLIMKVGNLWMPSEMSAQWLAVGHAERWGVLATAWLDGLPPDIRALLGERSHAMWGDHLEDFVRWLYPAGGEWMQLRMHEYVSYAERLGIAANSVPSTPGAALLANGVALAVEEMRALFPAEVDSVYLQHDLTIVSPGPLKAAIDQRLRLLANVESRAIATTYRVSAASLNRALAAGETEESLTAFLSEIALTGIPQPLGYLLTETAARHGILRVGAGETTYIRSDDPNLIGILLADQRLTPLALRRGGPHRIHSAFDVTVVFWMLSDARYPVAAEDENGELVHIGRRTPVAVQTDMADPATTIIERLRAAKDRAPETSRAWLERQLEVAIKAKLTVEIIVAMPNGDGFSYLVEPTGLAGGRLRALDRRADIERTLPLSSITEVRPAG